MYGTLPATAPFQLGNDESHEHIFGRKHHTDNSCKGLLYGSDDTRVGYSHTGGKRAIPLWLQDKTSAEIKKKNVQAKEIGDHYNQLQQNKASQMISRDQEKRQDLEMLKNFKPWGKPGGGAPRGFGGDRTQLMRTKQVNNLLDNKEQVLPLGRPGHGAPNRTESGKLMTGLKSDINVRLQAKAKVGSRQDVQHLDQHVKEEYKTQLDKLAEESRTKRSEEKKREINDELETLRHFPFGRPGGGAPLKSDSGKVKAALPLQMSNDIYELRNVEPRHPHAFNNEKNVNDKERSFLINRSETLLGSQQDLLKSDENNSRKNFGLEFGKHGGGGGAPKFDERGKVITHNSQTLVAGAVVKTKDNSSYPIGDYPGRGGAGAPLRDSNGKLVTHIAGRLDKDRMDRQFSDDDIKARRDYLETLQKMKDEAKTLKQQEREEMYKHAPNVVSWVRRGNVGQPNYDPVTHEIRANPLISSDVTRQKMEIRPQNIEESRRYLEDLNEHQRLKSNQKAREEQEQREQSVQHVQTMEHIWGRPGHGAPLNNTKKQKVDFNPVDYGKPHRDF